MRTPWRSVFARGLGSWSCARMGGRARLRSHSGATAQPAARVPTSTRPLWRSCDHAFRPESRDSSEVSTNTRRHAMLEHWMTSETSRARVARACLGEPSRRQTL
eukprot:Amastigsp_a510313_21.p3 type:complete len:104 gc:universal Amastigsp_a510313_21:946-1257(+)